MIKFRNSMPVIGAALAVLVVSGTAGVLTMHRVSQSTPADTVPPVTISMTATPTPSPTPTLAVTTSAPAATSAPATTTAAPAPIAPQVATTTDPAPQPAPTTTAPAPEPAPTITCFMAMPTVVPGATTAPTGEPTQVCQVIQPTGPATQTP
jgi:hypothetical protein